MKVVAYVPASGGVDWGGSEVKEVASHRIYSKNDHSRAVMSPGSSFLQQPDMMKVNSSELITRQVISNQLESNVSLSDEDLFSNSEEESHMTVRDSKSIHQSQSVRGAGISRPGSALQQNTSQNVTTPHLHISLDQSSSLLGKSDNTKRKTFPSKTTTHSAKAGLKKSIPSNLVNKT